ncbi:PREDICTED: carcinoembryonic antigen-related cell adhesion molecule 18 [Myotis davidii]|uniref:carcinoembryonic antigen-related cell adhesion molecule 18 n=1 Tax=Myotis davidii TaxID=225400 RepID=UPI0003EC0C33|nr:PREDICTED: carcinoembryonic antigen-related cell adhesion molecule 18 [Myotis davidii]
MHLSRPRRSPWRELVLVASLLACGICQASGQISIISSPWIEGFEAFLELKNVPEGVQEYSWHRGANDNADSMIVSYQPPSHAWQRGPMYSSRENVTVKGDLVIKDSQLNDTGSYTVRVNLSTETQTATGWLEIHKWEGDPGISANTTSVVEYRDPMAVFCHTNVTDATRIQWYVNVLNVSSNEQMTISPDRKTLTLHHLSRYDFTIRCGIENVLGLPQKSDYIFPKVFYGPDSVLLRTKPSKFSNVLPTEVGSAVQLDCTSTSSPGPTYRWIHNGSFLSSEASLSFPSLTWEQMGRYRCIVENPVTQLRFYRDIRIQRPRTIPEIRTGFYLSGPLVVFFIVMTVLGGVYLCGVLIYFLITRFSTRS